MNAHPIVEMFWVAEYDNGQALPQYNPLIYPPVENRYGWVDHKKVLRLWWIPITPELTRYMPNTRYNPLLQKHSIETRGSKGYVVRRCTINLTMGGKSSMPSTPRHKVACYVIGIEGGYRKEIYPDGTVKEFGEPRIGETQDCLHHG